MYNFALYPDNFFHLFVHKVRICIIHSGNINTFSLLPRLWYSPDLYSTLWIHKIIAFSLLFTKIHYSNKITLFILWKQVSMFLVLKEKISHLPSIHLLSLQINSYFRLFIRFSEFFSSPTDQNSWYIYLIFFFVVASKKHDIEEILIHHRHQSDISTKYISYEYNQ